MWLLERRPEMPALMREHLPNQYVRADAIADGHAQRLQPCPITFAAIEQPALVWQGWRDDAAHR